MKKEGSVAEFYDLAEIPFEPTGSATEKYPYVAPKKFGIIEEKIDEVVNEKKLYVVLFRAPQGGGKTATAAELRRRIEAKRYAAGKGVLILNRLLDLNFSHYAADFIEEAKPLLPDFRWEKYGDKTSSGELRNAVASVLKNLGEKYRLVTWVIDEFDIMVDHPKEKQSQFLQVLRDILEKLSNESLPILFIMSHTMKSSKEFERHLKEVHGPFQSRIVATLDIGYTYSETRAIVTARLRSVRKKELVYNSIAPFSEEAMKELYNLVVVTGGTGELNDFRLFERCCYFAILNGARGMRKVIDKDDVQQVFQELYKPLARAEGGERLSLGVRAELAGILSGPPMTRNEAALRGLVSGLKLMKDQFGEITGVRSTYDQKVVPDIHVSSLKLEVVHKPTGKRISAVWVLAIKEDGIILQDDLKKVDQILPKIREETSTYLNLTILSYVSDLDFGRTQITNCDQVIRISPDTMRDLLGLGLVSSTEDDVDLLRRNFDSDIAPLVRRIFDESTRDITKEVSPTTCRIVKSFNLAHAADFKLTKEALKDEDKKLFGSSTRVADKHLAELVALGFAKEQGTEIVPSLPRALSHLELMLQKQTTLKADDVSKVFSPNGEAVLNAAQNLGIVTIDEEERVTRRGHILKKDLEKEIEAIQSLLSADAMRTFDGERAQQIIKAAEKAKADDLLGTMVLSAAQELLPSIRERLSKASSVTGEKSVSKGQVQVKETAKPLRQQSSQVVKTETGKLERAILSMLERGQPMTLEQLKEELATQGFSMDTTGHILSMVVHSRLKLAL